MPSWSKERAVTELASRQDGLRDGGRLTDEWPELDLVTAYEIQDALTQQRVARGERVIGVKLGLTSAAKQQRMGISAPLTAWLTDAMLVHEDSELRLSSFIHPRLEPEIVFVMGRTLRGPGITLDAALSAVRSVHAGFEVIDSRFRDFSFALPDVVADNASASAFLMSSVGTAPGESDLISERCDLIVDGETVDSATGEAIQGHPAQALALAANALSNRGQAIEEGWIVLTGGLTDAVFLNPESEYVAAFSSLGQVRVKGV